MKILRFKQTKKFKKIINDLVIQSIYEKTLAKNRKLYIWKWRTVFCLHLINQSNHQEDS